MPNRFYKNGYSLVEVIVILLIFSMMFMVILVLFQNSIVLLNNSKAKIVGVELANEQMEILKNLAYGDVGTTNGSPVGTVIPTRQVTRSNINYTITTDIKYIDDPFDGCVGSANPPDPNKSKCADGTIVDKPQDIPANNGNPADYKKTDVEISWDKYYSGKPIKISTIIAPKGLEGDTTKGFLLITVFDAMGASVNNASVHVINSTLVPVYDKIFSTDSLGNVLLLDMEPAVSSYVIKISKAGYSEDRTCAIDAGGTVCTDVAGNPDPINKNLTIAQGQLEEISFAIDQFSNLTVNSYDENCTIIPDVNFTLQGAKTISQPPSSILKNVIPFQTSGLGQRAKNDLEWDLYDLLVNTSGYDIAGINHDLALNILPNTNTTLNVLLASHTVNSLLITVKDSSGTNLSGANVRLTKTGYDETKVTGHGFADQTDWIGGSGQFDFIDASKYFSDNSQVDTSTTSGQITLRKNSPQLNITELFESDFNKDVANTTADWNTLDQELKLPTIDSKYPINNVHYAQSKKLNSQQGKIISATLTATDVQNSQTINYLLSADGGVNFESVTPGTLHNFAQIGSELLFRVELTTNDENITPIVKDLTVSYAIEYFENSGELISSTFNLGSAATFTTINWQPNSQIPETGVDSVKFQIATNNDNSTWNFIGPDGTASTYYAFNNANINASHNGNTYLRYKLFLSTINVYYTPQLSDIRIGYTLVCLPPGQAYFKNLDNVTYSVEVNLTGYETYTTNIDVNGYTSQNLELTPIP